ncbi:tannase/feruloyl esterase family alpha/beta hydrolase [Ruegeria arenilitoris]|uniref:tannase/feruloyl esterase family alpha/beta hydrolase n=1 Tax=Ruegeria arenilitoris TaxID=1173585 RepID=UPI001CFE4052|nr:tannase/feruloyl esterase family alpha/beta hydrolase [Ruegeria arenilitoris]
MPLTHIKNFVASALVGGFVAVASAANAVDCSVEAIPNLPDVRILSAEVVPNPAAHCRVVGEIGTETGFELLLPDDWNGKFIMGGGGGFSGDFNNAAFLAGNILGEGWATVTTDTGHKGNNGDASWALNNLERQVNFGFQAVHRTAVTAKAIIAEFYGSEIERNLFYGCSRGGGQALMVAQRSPDLFEGIYAGAPAYSWTQELGGRWLYDAMNMFPDPNQIVTPVLDVDAQALIGNAIMDECDAIDGLEDGILNDPRQCTFDVSSLQCGDGQANQCLSEKQVRVAVDLYREVEFGGSSWPGMPMGVELPGNPLGWSLWNTGGYVEGTDVDFHPGEENAEEVFPAPPMPNATWGFAMGMFRYFFLSDPDWTYEGYDFSDFAHHAARVSPTLDADDPNLSEFRGNGGKLIIDNSWMDGSMSAYGTIDYYEKVLEFDPAASEDVRLFVRPGVTHCRGGPGPDGTNYIAALEEWLDTDLAPEHLDAPYVNPVTRQPTGQGGRIICAHPTVVTYDGSGDPSSPDSFSCEIPE